ncbi:MAG: metal-dependent transcriptional regulator [Actinobacteria bacterium]|nr:metal-dependent transcriptional regulator [Actinomycetota bacterium]MCL5025218.1 metal-dependent transcriptional regulator [Chloroflexota bacterium]
MDLSDDAQEILERLWIHSQEAQKDGLPLAEDGAALDEAAVRELADNNLVRAQDGRLELTPDGLPEAQSAVRRHRLAERLMADVLDTSDPMMDESACRFEHLLHRELEQRVCTLLGHPRVCPHGRPIPPGDCCRRAAKGGPQLVAPLSALKPGRGGTIAYLNTQEPRELQKLMSMGILPGMPIDLIQDFPSYVFRLHHSQFAVDKDLAGRIYVRLAD